MPSKSLVLAFLATVCAGAVSAQTAVAAAPANAANAVTTAAPAAKPVIDQRAAIAKKLEGLKVEDVRISPVPGIFEVTRDSNVSYITSDGRYAIVGDMVDLDSDANLSENRRRAIRQRLIDTVPENEMVVFSPKDPKYTITVFTDIDCGYCRKLHSQIAEYNRLGIRVRYLFFPRSGPDTDSWHKAEEVWCASNRNDALTKAKNGEKINSKECGANNIVARDYELGHKVGVDGTPAIFLASGEMLPGYAPPGTLMQYLKAGK
ncbi:MAG TPA: DsbC family protein [Steroidobacteraceae bacterium]|nr:DsbC family protein [Steroidobacteraceae bacterium]